jgi:predicted nuclease of predicted toxin-antitoxin system
MKLLFDQNLSFKLCRLLADAFPESNQIRLIGMEEAEDRAIWDHAKTDGFILVSQDVDFADMATLYGPAAESHLAAVWHINQLTQSNNGCAIMRKQ